MIQLIRAIICAVLFIANVWMAFYVICHLNGDSWMVGPTAITFMLLGVVLFIGCVASFIDYLNL